LFISAPASLIPKYRKEGPHNAWVFTPSSFSL
jgi:hypothetical protein